MTTAVGLAAPISLRIKVLLLLLGELHQFQPSDFYTPALSQ